MTCFKWQNFEMKRYRVWIFISAFIFIASACSLLQTKETKSLVNPFASLATKQRPTSLQSLKCPQAPTPIIDVMSQTYYSDPHHSIIDPELLEQSRESAKPLRTFNNQIAHLSDRLWKFDDLNAENCLYTWLSIWADAGALLGDANYQGEFERKWNLSGIALAYLKIESLVHWTPGQKAKIVGWLEKIAKRVRMDYDKKLDRQSRRNNHIYWAGLSVMAPAISTGDRELYGWGLNKARKGAMDVTSDGFLPEELDRGRRARHYQSFALQALTMMAFLANANGTDIYSINDGSLNRLAKKTIEGYENNSVFEKATAIQQEPIDPKDLDWTAAYLFENPLRSLPQELQRDVVMFSPWLGGDLSAIFSVRR